MSYLLEKVKTNLSFSFGSDFENIAVEILKHIYGQENINQIHANVAGGGTGDGGIDYFNHNEQTWFSVYGQKQGTKNPEQNFKNKIRSDYKKAFTNKNEWRYSKWTFICNKYELGHDDHNILNTIHKPEATNFIIDIFDIDRLSREILGTDQGRELLYKLEIIEEEDLVLECRKSTIDELRDELRNSTSQEIIEEYNKDFLTGKIDSTLIGNKIVSDYDLKLAEDNRMSYLRNYIPLLLDGGSYSEMLQDGTIELRFIDNLKSDTRNINKEYTRLEDIEQFVNLNHDRTKSKYASLERDGHITERYLLNDPDSVSGCFYHQVIKDNCSLENNGSDSIRIITNQ